MSETQQKTKVDSLSKKESKNKKRRKKQRGDARVMRVCLTIVLLHLRIQKKTSKGEKSKKMLKKKLH